MSLISATLASGDVHRCAAVQGAGLHGRGAGNARQKSRMSQAPEHSVQLAALDQNAQLPKLSSAPALNIDAPARSDKRPVDNMDVDGAPGSNTEFEGWGAGTSTGGDPSHASQAPEPAAAPPLQTNDVMITLMAIAQPLMTMIQNLMCNPQLVDQQTRTTLQQMCNTVKPHWKAVKEFAQTSSTGNAPAGQAIGEKQADKHGSAKQHEAAKLPGQTAAVGQSALPQGEIAAASEQATDAAAKRLPGPQGPAAAEGRLGEAATTLLLDPAPGQYAMACKLTDAISDQAVLQLCDVQQEVLHNQQFHY